MTLEKKIHNIQEIPRKVLRENPDFLQNEIFIKNSKHSVKQNRILN